MEELEQMTEEMLEDVCDRLCRFPGKVDNQVKLDEACAVCRMGWFRETIMRLQDGHPQLQHKTSNGKFKEMQWWTVQFHIGMKIGMQAKACVFNFQEVIDGNN